MFLVRHVQDRHLRIPRQRSLDNRSLALSVLPERILESSGGAVSLRVDSAEAEASIRGAVRIGALDIVALAGTADSAAATAAKNHRRQLRDEHVLAAAIGVLERTHQGKVGAAGVPGDIHGPAGIDRNTEARVAGAAAQVGGKGQGGAARVQQGDEGVSGAAIGGLGGVGGDWKGVAARRSGDVGIAHAVDGE